MEQLKSMKETLMRCVQGEIGDLKSADAQELGAAVDMIKDLSEAIYYCTITEAMEYKEKNEEKEHYYYPMERGSRRGYSDYMIDYPYYMRDMDRGMGRMYYNGDSSSGGNNTRGGGTRGYREMGEIEIPFNMRDIREGKSPMSRKTYMESKEMHQDKTIHMKELENYMQELSQDITEMIQNASPEEKQLMQNKITMLASKIK